MILKKVYIENFRSIKNETLDFENDTCKILVGINGAGKSNVLKAIHSLSACYGPENIRRPAQGEEIEDYSIRFVFSLLNDETSTLYSSLEYLFYNPTKKFFLNNTTNESLSLKELVSTACVFIKENSSEKYRHSSSFNYYVFSSDVITAKIKNGITQENLPDGYTVNQKYFLNEDFKEEFYDRIDGDYHQLINTIDKIIEPFIKTQISNVVFWQYTEENILPSEINYQTFLKDPTTNNTLKALFELCDKPNWNNEILKRIADRNHIDSYLKNNFSKTILQYFKTKWPELKLKDFTIRVDGDNLRFAFIDEEDNEYNANERSDGFKRFITFLILISGKNTIGTTKNSILIIDEPDIAIHIKGQMYLLKELLNIADNNIVIFSTHSPFMIDKSNIGRHYMVKKSDEVTTLTISDQSNFSDEEVLFQALGYSVFCNIKEKNILFEGYWDNYVFNLFKDERFNQIGNIYMGGVKNAQSVSKTVELQEKHYHIISDSDKPAKTSKKEFKKVCEGKWTEYGEIVEDIHTLEDFVVNARIKNALSKVIKLTSYESLKNLDVSFVDSLTTKKLDKITSKCLQLNQSIDTKDFQSKLKEKIFKSIKKEDIDSSYENILNFILTEI